MKAVSSIENSQLQQLLNEIKKGNKPVQKDVDDFISDNLSASQAQTVKSVLNNPALIKKLLESRQAKELMQKLFKEEE